MRTLTATILLLMTVALTAAQIATPTPQDDDVVKITTNLIQLDVSITDAKGKPISDIRRDEIEIYENGEKQPVSGFTFVSSARTTQEKVKVDENAVPLPPTVIRPENVRRTIAIVVDDLSLSFQSAYQTRRSLKKFVDEQMQDGDMVAIVRTGAGIGALQQFTADKRILYAAIERVRWNPQGTGGITAFAPIEAAPDTSLQTSGNEESEDAPTGSGQTLDDFRAQVFATGTLGALRYIVQGMSQLPGRKSVILFSDGFKLFETNGIGAKETSMVYDFVRELVDVANRASVVFYTVDARGLQFTGITAEDSITDTSPDALNAVSNSRRDQLLDNQEGLSFLADETGGFAVKNNNDLAGGVRKILDDQSYYLVGYEPDGDTFDAAKRKYNKVEIKVLRKGATVRYRSGFFNLADKVVPPAASAALSPIDQLETALVSPFAVNGINLRLNALYGNDARSGDFVRSLLHINGADLKFVDEPGERKKAVFDVLAMSFGDNGQLVEKIAKTYTLTIKADGIKRLIDDGIVYHFSFPVKKPGAYQFRVAIRDAQGGKVGSASQFIEVPDLKKERLTLSSLVIENLSPAEWAKLNDPNAMPVKSDAMSTTALRRVKRDSVLRYGYEIYNAKVNNLKSIDATVRVRVFRDGKLFYEGTEAKVDTSAKSDPRHIRSAGALAIGRTMTPGDYILQVVVTDKLAKTKSQIATQFVQFEVVE